MIMIDFVYLYLFIWEYIYDDSCVFDNYIGDMSKRVDIEYCGSWGYGGPANRLKKSIQEANPGVEVNCRSAQGKTGKIEVRFVDEKGTQHQVWSNGKGETESNHGQIVAQLKAEGLWSPKPQR